MSAFAQSVAKGVRQRDYIWLCQFDGCRFGNQDKWKMENLLLSQRWLTAICHIASERVRRLYKRREVASACETISLLTGQHLIKR